jgi:hypothetical protein
MQLAVDAITDLLKAPGDQLRAIRTLMTPRRLAAGASGRGLRSYGSAIGRTPPTSPRRLDRPTSPLDIPAPPSTTFA